ncbi:Uncharacterised protein [Mycobacteroides abscessus subsp. abscessus]|nr:Uncharacterised protein [Mycobacteroides abscessus subsp. abscessus]
MMVGVPGVVRLATSYKGICAPSTVFSMYRSMLTDLRSTGSASAPALLNSSACFSNGASTSLRSLIK